ncbi:YchJ family metal-binding protein [Desulfuromonas sp. TF]|uniref:YchJ family metal-binding protein n=1 Tax=Desulfuromonas sp. TF TaxID=1232410 RepID=UPI00041A4EBC|nr:YchJ family metal-binding protein [Desulfuromonas sp. TF]
MGNAQLSHSMSPSELVLARCRAFGGGNFGFIYDSYHPESYFRAQFPSRRAYLRHGASSLAADFRIRECRILKEQINGEEARVLFYLDAFFRDERAESFELSSFRMTAEGWRYHSSQKLARREFAGEIEEIGFRDFENVQDKVFF